MALKGQGDPRWIVEERADGRNVNNWHWTETDYSAWAKNKLTEFFGNLEIENDDIKFKTSSLTCTGDVSVNTRKQKTFLFYELDVSIKWEGTLKSTSTTGKGSIHLPYISEENPDDDFEIKFSVEGDTRDHDNLKDKIRTVMIPILKQKVPQMLTELREVALGQTKLPPKQAPSNNLEKLEQKVTVTPPPTTTPTVTTKSSGPRLVNISVTEKFVCRPVDLFQCFIETNRVRAYAGSDAQVDGKNGGKFSMFGGAVVGEFVEVDVPNKIVQKWRFNSWPESLWSTVTLTFEEKSGKTVLKIEQKGIPEDDKERTEGGWQQNFCRRIKGVFGFGGLN